jgi:hypothetical protein
VVDPPAATVRLEGVMATEKSGAPVIVRVMLVECVALVDVPVTVRL